MKLKAENTRRKNMKFTLGCCDADDKRYAEQIIYPYQ